MRARPFGVTALGVVSLALLLSGAGPAAAGFVTYSVGSSTFSFQGDTFTNSPFAGAVGVPDGGSVLAELQPGVFNVGESGQFTGTAPFSLSESFVANGVSSSVKLVGTLSIAPDGDTLAYVNGMATVVTLPNGQTLTVTPQPLTLFEPSLGSYPYTLEATFALSATPEPASLTLLGIGGLGLLGYGWRKRRQARAAA